MYDAVCLLYNIISRYSGVNDARCRQAIHITSTAIQFGH